MNERDMMHGVEWSGQELGGWYLSEKLDGCRAFWDGSQFWTRGGNVIQAPDRIVSQMPAVALDGEMYAGKGTLSVSKLAVQLGRFDPRVEFVCFDAPTAPGDWRDRMRLASSQYKSCVEVATIESSQSLRRQLTSLWIDGGEGFIARKPDTAYSPGRCNTVLKVKHLC